MQLARIHITLLSSISLICFTDCKRGCKPPALQNNQRLLIVDGTLTNAPDSTYITLTSSRNISGSAFSPAETNATCLVETENTTCILLEEIRSGVYGVCFLWTARENTGWIYIQTEETTHLLVTSLIIGQTSKKPPNNSERYSMPSLHN